jgi:hypothetical protein
MISPGVRVSDWIVKEDRPLNVMTAERQHLKNLQLTGTHAYPFCGMDFPMIVGNQVVVNALVA